jgi:DNA-directed RNA polymerase specialized sigma24 family protein
MSSEGSVTRWIAQAKAGDPLAVQRLWERYFPRLVGLARGKLQGLPRRAIDEEDVALSAFHSFCRNAERGSFPRLTDRDSLWRLLVVITARKAVHLVRDEQRQKRGGPRPVAGTGSPDDALVERLLSQEPSPAFAAEVAEEYRRLMARLADRELEGVATWKMEGYTNAEIASRLGCAPRSVERKLQLIRTIWEEAGPS